MCPFRKLLDSGLPVNWCTIEVGWDGIGCWTRLVSPEEVIAYAIEQMLSMPTDEVPACLLDLASAHDEETDEIARGIRCLAVSENADSKVEQRKWRLVLLKDLMRHHPEDPFEGLLQFTEFWADMDFPEDSPHSIQGIDDNLTPQEYYTTANFHKIREQHRQWIEKEERLLRGCR